MVMAVGNVGEYLDPAADASCTWLSRDGGLSWEVNVNAEPLIRAHVPMVGVQL